MTMTIPKSKAFAALMALVLAAPMTVSTMAFAGSPTGAMATTAEASTIEQAIEALHRWIKTPSRKPMPVWAIDTATRVITAWRTYTNGKKFEEASRIALAALKEVAAIKAMVEDGLEITDREYRLVRDSLEAQAGRLDLLTGRVDRVEQATAEHAARVRTLEMQAEAAEARARYFEARTRALEGEVGRLSGDNRRLAGDLARQQTETARHRAVIRRTPCGTGKAYRYAVRGCVDVAAHPR